MDILVLRVHVKAIVKGFWFFLSSKMKKMSLLMYRFSLMTVACLRVSFFFMTHSVRYQICLMNLMMCLTNSMNNLMRCSGKYLMKRF